MANKLKAYDVRIEETRRTARAGCLLPSVSRFFSQMPHFRAPASVVAPGRTASGTFGGGMGEITEDGPPADGLEGEMAGADSKINNLKNGEYSRASGSSQSK